MHSFEEYHSYVAGVFAAVPQWPDVVTLLAYIQGRSGETVSYNDLMKTLNTDDAMRVLSATVILTGGRLPILLPFFRVRSSDGTMHRVDSISRECLDGKMPYLLEATGESFDHVGTCAFLAYQVADFTL